MRISHALTAIGAAALLGTGAVAMDMSKEEKAAHTRQGLMDLFVWSAGPLFAMVKGDVPYDAETAAAQAANLAALTKYNPVSLFVPGSSTEELGDKTRALPAIWEETDEFVKYYGDLGKKAAAVAEVAGNGLDALRPAVKELGQACGACHDDFRKDTD